MVKTFVNQIVKSGGGMADVIRVALVGIGGYGQAYVECFLHDVVQAGAELVGAVDPFARKSAYYEDLKSRRVQGFDDLDGLLAEQPVDLVVLSSPIQWHMPQTCLALEHGVAVLCEKPAAGTIQDVRRMIAAEAKAGRPVGVGYQWSYSETIQHLKRDIMSGVFGRPKRLRTMVCWPRPHAYFQRNKWAGALRDADGRWILDSPVNNATAHYLHNMLYVLGETVGASAVPVSVEGELYRANGIENFDTGMLRCRTADGAELLYYATHAVDVNHGPVAIYEFEDATVCFGGAAEGDSVVATFQDGRRVEYGVPDARACIKLNHAIDRARTGEAMFCPPGAAAAQTLCMNGLQDSVDTVVEFPGEYVSDVAWRDGDRLTVVKGLDGVIATCFEAGKLPSEMGNIPWSRSGRLVDLKAYGDYPRGS